MRKESNVLSALKSLISALCIVLVTASHAFANNAPGPLAVVSMLSLVILLVVLTFAGGGYRVLEQLHKAKYPSKLKRTLLNVLEFVAGLVLFFVGMMATILGVLVLALYTIGRGVRMLQWARAAEKVDARPAHLEGANPKRLKIAGVMLIVLTLLVAGYSMINIDDVTGTSGNKKRMYARMLGYDAKNAHSAAMAFLDENPKAWKVTCEDMVNTGYNPTPDVTCSSDMTATSGVIRITGPERWKLSKPIAVITYAGELTPAEP